MPVINEVKLSLLRLMDAQLLTIYDFLKDISVDSLSSIKTWFRLRVSQGVPSHVLLRLISTTYKVEMRDSQHCINGVWLDDGFYCRLSKKYFAHNPSYFDSILFEELAYGILIPDDISPLAPKRIEPEKKSNSMPETYDHTLKNFMEFYLDKWSHRGVEEISIKKGMIYAGYGVRDIFLGSCPSNILNIGNINCNNISKKKTPENLWKVIIRKLTDYLESGASRKLSFLSGDEAVIAGEMCHSMLLNKTNLKVSIVSAENTPLGQDVYIANMDVLIENPKAANLIIRSLEESSSMVVITVGSRHIVDLFEASLKVFPVDILIKHWGRHHFRIAMPRICKHCKSTEEFTNVVNFGYQFNMSSFKGYSQGPGCTKCVDGISGIYGISCDVESGGDFDALPTSIIHAYFKSEPHERTFAIVKEFNNNSVPTVFKSLESALSHGLVQVSDAKRVLI